MGLTWFCQGSPETSYKACSIPAQANRISVAFAAFLQMPTVFPWHLQHSCKCQPYFRGACSVPAKANRISAALAAFLQRPTVFPWRLQHSCKGQPYLRGACSVPANLPAEKAALFFHQTHVITAYVSLQSSIKLSRVSDGHSC